MILIMSGCNHPCEFCGAMSDDYEDFDCCERQAESMRMAGKINVATQAAEMKILGEMQELLWFCRTPEEVEERGKTVVEFLKAYRKKLKP